MKSLRVPKQYVSGFKFFLGLEPNEQQGLLNFLQNSNPSESHESLLEGIVDTLGNGNKEYGKAGLSILSLIPPLLDFEGDEMSFALKVTDALIDAEILQKENSETVEKLLVSFFTNSRSLLISFKKEELEYDREKRLSSTRVITDIRPIFPSGSTQELWGVCILQTLKIEFQEAENEESIYLALDDEDLESLRKQIIRAQEKSALLRRQLSQGPVSVI